MKERGILFSAAMVRALLAGTKTQTRRALRMQPPAETKSFCTYHHPDPRQHHYAFDGASLLEFAVPCPYGQPGDRLWVRETWMDLKGSGIEATTGSTARCAYRADTPEGSYGDMARKAYGLKWTPAIHMFRWASRIDLEVTRVRVERLQDISEADARAEGAPGYEEGVDAPPPDSGHEWSYRAAYRRLWEQINGPGSWDANPWVWAVDFKRVMP